MHLTPVELQLLSVGRPALNCHSAAPNPPVWTHSLGCGGRAAREIRRNSLHSHDI